MHRAQCPDDRRGTLATLTEQGMEVLREAAPGHVRTVREHLFDRLTPEQVTQLTERWQPVLAGRDDRDGAPAAARAVLGGAVG